MINSMEPTPFVYAAAGYLYAQSVSKTQPPQPQNGICSVNPPESVCNVVAAHPEQLLLIIGVLLFALFLNGWDE